MSTEEALPFEFVSEELSHGELRVVSLAAEEELHGAYRVEVELACAADPGLLASLEPALLGRPAAVLTAIGHGRRRLQGTVTALRLAGLDAQTARVHVEIRPRFALLALRRQSRIFQDKTVREIVEQVLGEWKIAHGFHLTGSYRPRPYATQHGETDHDFVLRLLAFEGIGFYFAPAPPGASLKDAPEIVFFDAAAYPTIPAPEGGHAHGSTLRHVSGAFEHGEDDVLDFALHREIGAKAAILGDFDFRRPQVGLRAGSHAAGAGSATPADVEMRDPLDAYFYADRVDLEGGGPKLDDARAQRAFEQLRREVYAGRGTTRNPRLLPGHAFTLEGHPIDALNQDYVVTRVEHTGRAPQQMDARREVYSARFSCVPADVIHRPPFERSLRAVHGAETATVVGASGEDVHTDEHGRVKVRFHWDARGKGDDTSSCWLRVAQGWAGQRWGAQFVPRVGMEVLVTFLGGDVDRPLVTGCLYNATHPTPFRLPTDKYRSGFRTQTGGGGGHNELSFEDAPGEEQVLVHAHRDLVEEVGRDHVLTVERDETHRVRGSSTASVGGSRKETILGDVEAVATGHHVATVGLDQTLSVKGDRTDEVSGDQTSRVGGDRKARVDGRVQEEIGGRAEVTLKGDAVLRAQGHLVTVVGQHDAPKSATVHVEGRADLYTTGAAEIVAEKGLVLRVGKSSIRMTPTSIELAADTIVLRGGKDVIGTAEEEIQLFAKKRGLFKSDKKIYLQAEGGSVQLTRDARVDGDTVKLNCSPDPVDDKAPEDKPIKPTKFSLVDQDGKPMAGQRLVLVMPDGSERTAILDADGKAELELEDSGDVIFPDVSKPESA